MNILFIGPLPEPMTGQSLACQVFYDELIKSHHVKLINLSKNTFVQGINSITRIIEMIKILQGIFVNRSNSKNNIIYFNVSQSYAGNLKDILIYLICFKQLSKMIIHLHGGAGMRDIMLGKNHLLRWLNNYFVNKLGAIIVLGSSHTDIYSNVKDQTKIHIVPNFAQDYLFTTTALIQRKFAATQPIKILFLSNLLPGKGHIELVQAFMALDEATKAMIEIDFAGGFESPEQEHAFLKLIEGVKQIGFHGKVGGDKKKKLFTEAHIFCLPTYYPYEGQPISILEAYASGCAVITTDHSGIYDVFTDQVNGFSVIKKDTNSLKTVIVDAIKSPELLEKMAMNNLLTAQKNYKTEIYNTKLMQIVNLIS